MLERHDQAITYCTFCPKLCRHACPVAHAEARETVTPQGKQSLLDQVRRGLAPLDHDAVDVFHRCTGCGLHATACELEVEVAPVMFDARAEGVKAGVVHPALADLEDRVEQPARRPGELSGSVFLPGCTTQPSLADAGLAAARRLDPGVNLADGVGCCGYPLLAGGRPDAFHRQAAAVGAALAGTTRVITGDPICAWTLGHAWPDPFPAEHIAQAASCGAPIPSARRPRGRPAYHDPCHLSRKLGVTEEPRELIAAVTGAAPIELPWSKSGGWCSGGGGLLPATAPDTASAIADDLRRQAKGAGADWLITACPRCHDQLDGDPELPVVDLTELLRGG